MTTESRPSEDPKWAESADAGDVSDPSGKRSSGWAFEDLLPYDNMNWIQRALGRWVQYLDSKLTGDYGGMEVTQDTSSVFKLAVQSGLSGLASRVDLDVDRLIADEVSAPSSVFSILGDLNVNTIAGIAGRVVELAHNGQPGAGHLDARNSPDALARVEMTSGGHLTGSFGFNSTTHQSTGYVEMQLSQSVHYNGVDRLVFPLVTPVQNGSNPGDVRASVSVYKDGSGSDDHIYVQLSDGAGSPVDHDFIIAVWAYDYDPTSL